MVRWGGGVRRLGFEGYREAFYFVGGAVGLMNVSKRQDIRRQHS